MLIVSIRINLTLTKKSDGLLSSVAKETTMSTFEEGIALECNGDNVNGGNDADVNCNDGGTTTTTNDHDNNDNDDNRHIR